MSYIVFDYKGFLFGFNFIVGYFFGTYFLGPDLDIKSRPYYRWKKLRFIWLPYQKMFSHRSIWTHGVIIGDIVRVIYFLIILFIPYAILIVSFNFNSNQINRNIYEFMLLHYEYFLCLFLGIVFASLLHIISDLLVSNAKKRKKKRSKKKVKKRKYN